MALRPNLLVTVYTNTLQMMEHSEDSVYSGRDQNTCIADGGVCAKAENSLHRNAQLQKPRKKCICNVGGLQPTVAVPPRLFAVLGGYVRHELTTFLHDYYQVFIISMMTDTKVTWLSAHNIQVLFLEDTGGGLAKYLV